MKYIRGLIAFITIFGITTSIFGHWLLLASYQYNKQYITSVLCSNRQSPEKHCDGKCIMDMRLKEMEQKHKQTQENLKRTVQMISHLVIDIPSAPAATPSDKNFYHLKGNPTYYTTSIFQPPKCAFA